MNPHSCEILNNLGLCTLNIGDVDQAIIFLSEAVKENFEFTRALNNLGNALRKKNQVVQAIKMYEQAVKITQYHIQSGLVKERYHIGHLNLASAYTEINQILKAIEHLEYALENNHKTIINYAKSKGLDYYMQDPNILKAIVAYENKEYEQVMLFLDKIYELYSDNPVISYYYGMTCLKQCQFNQSSNFLQKVIVIFQKKQGKLVCRVFGQKSVQGLEELKFSMQQYMRNQQIQMQMQSIKERKQGKSVNQESVKDLDKNERKDKMNKLSQYSSYNDSHFKKHRQTQEYQDVYSKYSNSKRDTPNSSMKERKKDNKGSFTSNISSVFFDFSILKDDSHRKNTKDNFEHPILASPQSFKPISGSQQNKEIQKNINSLKQSREGLPPLHPPDTSLQLRKGKEQILSPTLRTHNKTIPKNKIIKSNQSMDIQTQEPTKIKDKKPTMIQDYYSGPTSKRIRIQGKGESRNQSSGILTSNEPSENQRHVKEVYDSRSNQGYVTHRKWRLIKTY